MISMFRNGLFCLIFRHFKKKKVSLFSPEQVRGTADLFYLRPLLTEDQTNSVWFSSEALSSTIVDQILTRLKLLPDFYHQTKPVETTSTTTNFS